MEDTWPGKQAYTIGNLPQYEQWKHTPFYKDVGGSVWPTLESALQYLIYIKGALKMVDGTWAGAGVYLVALEGSWNDCTEPVEGQKFASLTKPARVVGTVCTHTNEAGRLLGGLTSHLCMKNVSADAMAQARRNPAPEAKPAREVKGEPKQVIVLRKDLEMPPGKAAAQAAHASLEAFLQGAVQGSGNTAGPHAGHGQLQMNMRAEDVAWREGSYAKIVVGVKSEEALRNLHAKAVAKGLRVALIEDEGRTVFDEPTVTALAIGPHYPEDLDPLTRRLRLYKG